MLNDTADTNADSVPPDAVSHSWPRRSVRQWIAGLHGGQLAMLELLILALALLTGGTGLVLGLSGWPARQQLAAGEYREGPQYVQIDGITYHVGEEVAKLHASKARIQFAIDSLLRAGQRKQVEVAERPGYFEAAAFVPSRDSLRTTARQFTWGTALAIAASLFLALSYWLPWTWLGARARSRAS